MLNRITLCVSAAIGAIAILSGCAVSSQRKADITTPSEIRKNVSDAQTCMSKRIATSGYNNVNVAVQAQFTIDPEEMVETTYLNDMVISALSNIANRSKVINIVPLNNEFLTGSSAPDYIVQVGELILDNASANDGDLGLSREQRAIGLQSLVSKAQLDMNVIDLEEGVYLNGVNSSNTISVNDYNTSISFGIGDINIDYSQRYNTQGSGEVARALVQYGVVELIGEMFRIPYWECLNINNSSEIDDIISAWSNTDAPLSLKKTGEIQQPPEQSRLVLDAACGQGISLRQREEIGIITGGTSGTYFQIGKDICELENVSEKGLGLAVYTSPGSLANLSSVLRERRSQLGIVQSDILQVLEACLANFDNFCSSLFVARENIEVLRKRIRVVFPLYDEEVHVLVRKSDKIKTLADLRAKKVWVGSEKSGHFMTANNIFRILGIRDSVDLVTATTLENIDDPLKALSRKSIDAIFYVGGQDIKLFSSASATQYADVFEFVPIQSSNIGHHYRSASISSKMYPFLESVPSVSSVSTKAMLMTYDYVSRAEESSKPIEREYFMWRHDQVCEVADLIEDNLNTLKNVGHSKWRSIEPDSPLQGWDKYSCQ